jgi:hypothetical protein
LRAGFGERKFHGSRGRVRLGQVFSFGYTEGRWWHFDSVGRRP